MTMKSAASRKTLKQDIESFDNNNMDDYVCGPCNVENKSNTAVGYCQYCRHYLCATCFGYHKNLGKIHVLLSRDAMPKGKPEDKLLRDPCMETCKDHKHKTVELYCRNHDEVCCVICVTLHHKKCDYDYIPNITESMGENVAMDTPNTLNMIQTLIGHFENFVSELSNQNKELERKKKEFGSGLRKFRKEINEYLDNLERQVNLEMRQAYEKETKLIADNISKCEEAMKSLSVSYANTKAVLSNKDRPNKTFTIVKMSQKHMRDLEVCLKAVHCNTFQVDLKFEPNPEIMRSLKKLKGFGKLVNKRTIVKFPQEKKDLQSDEIVTEKEMKDNDSLKQQGD